MNLPEFDFLEKDLSELDITEDETGKSNLDKPDAINTDNLDEETSKLD